MPIILASLLFALTYGTTLDFAFASFLYELQGGAWSLQHHWLTEIVLHKYVRDLNQILVVLLFGYWLVRQFYRKDRSQKQRALGGLLLSLILSYI
ncbi:MAG: hypothetical protein KKB00_15365, partial [Gammaproteobacteria bacterium]|nr:hypothetical protein [Gammaproteobacteria bacterium]